MGIFPMLGLNTNVAKTLLRLGLVAISLLWLPAPSFAAAQSRIPPVIRPQKFLILLPEAFRGWMCVDFGVAGAPLLPREGNARVIRPRQGEVLTTSDKSGIPDIFGEAWIEANGQRRPLPDDVAIQSGISQFQSGNPTERVCAFVGTLDEREAAGDSAPGFGNDSRPSVRISMEERKALEALYKATDGDHWKHHVSWLGPEGTECTWHGITCGSPYDPPGVIDIELSENNLSGDIPDALAGLTQLESVNIAGNKLSGKLPDALLKKWLSGSLWIVADPPAFTDVSEVDFESASTSILCSRDRIILRSDGTATLYSEKCRDRTPQDRATFCEVKHGRVFGDEFGTLAALLERNRFYSLKPKYSRSVTDVGFSSLRVVRGEKTYEVEEYAGGSPYEFWVITGFIGGLMGRDYWDSTTKIAKCPRWAKGRIPYGNSLLTP